jgi:hypothetical protein
MPENAVIITNGDKRWDNISFAGYGDDYDFNDLILANPSITIGAIIPSGTKIIIPLKTVVEQTIPTNNLPPWKQ